MTVPSPVLHDRFERPLRDLRISVTDRCNFRCGYCMPADAHGGRYTFLPRPALLRFEEIARLARIFATLGVRKLRITGGEPLLRAELPRLVEMLSAIEGVSDLALTTNATLLAARAEALAGAGLQRVTVSLDSTDPAVFARMSGGRGSLDAVLGGIDAAARAGLTPLKINCVVQRGVNDHTLVDLARRFRGTGHVVRFIEFMDAGTRNRWNLSQVVPAAAILERLGAAFPLEAVEPNYRGEVARRYRYCDGAGEIGIIASVTQPFCGDCSRVRLSPEGALVTCLFAQKGFDLRGPLRAGESDAAIRARVRAIWTRRADRYSEERPHAMGDLTPACDRIEMYRIGG